MSGGGPDLKLQTPEAKAAAAKIVAAAENLIGVWKGSANAVRNAETPDMFLGKEGASLKGAVQEGFEAMFGPPTGSAPSAEQVLGNNAKGWGIWQTVVRTSDLAIRADGAVNTVDQGDKDAAALINKVGPKK